MVMVNLFYLSDFRVMACQLPKSGKPRVLTLQFLCHFERMREILSTKEIP